MWRFVVMVTVELIITKKKKKSTEWGSRHLKAAPSSSPPSFRYSSSSAEGPMGPGVSRLLRHDVRARR